MKEKLKETSLATLGMIIVVSLCFIFNAAQFNGTLFFNFLLASGLSIVGQMIFLLGADASLTKVGKHTGTSLMKLKKPSLILLLAFLLGLIATVAEPDVQVLAELITKNGDFLNKFLFIAILGVGVGAATIIAFVRILKNYNHKIIFIIIFALIAILAIFASETNLMLAFDSSGATTGVITVPFIMALSIGLASLRGDGKQENNFGVVGIATTGTIISFLLFSFISKDLSYTLEVSKNSFFAFLTSSMLEVFIALLPLTIFFLIMQFAVFKFPKAYFYRILFGFVLSFVGLSLFVTSVIFGFAPIAEYLALSISSPVLIVLLLIAFAFVLVFTEPSIKILIEQINNGASTFVKRRYIFIAVSFAVILSFLLNYIKMAFAIHYAFIIFPLIATALILMLFAPKMFSLIAFDSGGIVAGTMLTSFVLPFFIGLSTVLTGTSSAALGTIATVTITPVIALETLGIIFKIKTAKKNKNTIEVATELVNPNVNTETIDINKVEDTDNQELTQNTNIENKEN